MKKIVFILLICTLAQAEDLVYNVKIWGINVGVQKISTKEEGNDIIIISETKTNKFFSKFYKMDDYIETLIDKRSLLPLKIEEKIDEKGYKKEVLTELNQRALRATIKENEKEEQIVLSAPTFNIPSLIHYLRNTEFIRDQSFPLITTGKVKNVVVMNKGIEMVTIKEKRYETRKISAGGVAVWFATNNLPIIIEAKLAGGLVLKGYLKE